MQTVLMVTLAAALPLAAAAQEKSPPAPTVRFIDATDAVGLGDLSAARVLFADLTGDGRPDAIIDRRRIFINTPDHESPLGLRFIERTDTGLPEPATGDVLVFADIDNDGKADAILARYLDTSKPPAEPAANGTPAPALPRTAWFKGAGDGAFGPAQEIAAARPATTSAIAIGDVNLDGLLDLYLGNWYSNYGQNIEAHTNDLLIQSRDGDAITFTRQPLEEDAHQFDDERDAAGRPTYGVMIAHLLQWAPRASAEPTEPANVDPAPEEAPEAATTGDSALNTPQLLDLNYGRRANRLWAHIPAASASDQHVGKDLAPELNLDGDPIRHGKHPEWLKIVAARDPRFDRPDEKPFRSHGNTFDAAIGDINNDGQFDLFLAEITHGWAGDSSDRSRLLIASQRKADPLTIFEPSPHTFDRIPPIPPQDQWAEGWFPRWNQGDLFCEMADLNNDGLLDIIISSGDYPDPAPFDQRLRIYMQGADGSFTEVTASSGISHIGSQQTSLGDVDGDGQLDILVGQTFNRFTPDMIAAAGGQPRLRLFLNRTHSAPTNAITLTLVGDPAQGVSRDALGAIVRMYTSSHDRTKFQSRQLIGIGGHAGKQHQLLIHFGLGAAARADRIEIHWPGAGETITTLPGIAPGHHTVRLAPDIP